MCSYVARGVRFEREVFASAPDQTIVVRLTASAPGQISFEARLQTPQRATTEATDAGDLVMRGVNGDGRGTTADGRAMTGALRFEARVRVLATGGTRTSAQGGVVVRGADAVTLLITAATSYKRFDDVTADPAARVAVALDSASRRRVDALRAAHVRDYQELFSRVTLDLGPSKAAPTDDRVRGFSAGGDPGLAALYFQYGRYLLIASSRPGSQPANLQGLWNDSMSPPWGSKYTININTADELLAGAAHEPRRDHGSAHRDGCRPDGDRRAHRARHVRGRRLGRASQHGSVARHGADRRPAVGDVADRRRLVGGRAVGSLRIHR